MTLTFVYQHSPQETKVPEMMASASLDQQSTEDESMENRQEFSTEETFHHLDTAMQGVCTAQDSVQEEARIWIQTLMKIGLLS